MNIPKIIHQIWIGDQSKRPQKFMDSWKEKHPGWDYFLWTDDNLPELTNGRQFEATTELSGKADILRYELLRKYGGIYIDADARCLNSLDDFFLENESFSCWENELRRPGLIANGFIGATKGNQLIERLIEGISKLDPDILADPIVSPTWMATGPQFLTNTINENPNDQITIYPSHLFIPNHFTGASYSGTDKVYADHVWGSTETALGKVGLDYELLSAKDAKKFRKPKGKISNKLKDPPPDVVEALVRLFEQGNHTAVVEATSGTIRKFKRSPTLLNILASSMHALGDDLSAIQTIKSALKLKPDFVNGLITLGNALRGANRSKEAIKEYEFALGVAPTNLIARLNRGSAFKDLGQLDEAMLAYMGVIETNPDYAPAHLNLGITLSGKNNHLGALRSFEEAIKLNPKLIAARLGRAKALSNLNRTDFAITELEQILTLNPNHLEATQLKAHCHEALGDLKNALDTYQSALRLDPSSLSDLRKLGSLLARLNETDQAFRAIEALLKLEPDDEVGLLNATFVQHKRQILNSAAGYGERAIANYPSNALAHSYLGTIYMDLGKIDRAIQMMDRAQELAEDWQEPMSNRCYVMNFADRFSQKDIYAYAKTFDRRFAKKLTPIKHDKEPSVESEKLRIGYISGDFRLHSSIYFFLPMLEAHDHEHFEIFCYYSDERHDQLTEQHKNNSDHWREISSLSDSEVVELITKDEVQILVDLSGHTAKNRLLVLAQKPAPVQAHWMIYANTIGLSAIDYRFTDSIMDPPEKSDNFHVESLYRLEDGVICYRGPEFLKGKRPLPSLEGAPFTFGSLNSLAKLTDRVVKLWSRVLLEVPNARLLLATRQFKEEEIKEQTTLRFLDEGVGRDQLVLTFGSSQEEVAKLYQQIDVGLDPFPFNGVTTTGETLWAGVPVVALRGETSVARTSASILENAGIPELICEDEAQYLEKAVVLAEDQCLLVDTNNKVQSLFRESPVCDGEKHARKVEAAYQDMWRRYQNT